MLGRAAQVSVSPQSTAQVGHRGTACPALAVAPASLPAQAAATVEAARGIRYAQHAHRVPLFMTVSVSSHAGR